MFRYQVLKETQNNIELTIYDKLLLIRKIELELGFETFEYSEDPKFKEYQVTKRLNCLRNLRKIKNGIEQKREYYNIKEPIKKKKTIFSRFRKKSLSKSASSNFKDYEIDYIL